MLSGVLPPFLHLDVSSLPSMHLGTREWLLPYIFFQGINLSDVNILIVITMLFYSLCSNAGF